MSFWLLLYKHQIVWVTLQNINPVLKISLSLPFAFLGIFYSSGLKKNRIITPSQSCNSSIIISKHWFVIVLRAKYCHIVLYSGESNFVLSYLNLSYFILSHYNMLHDTTLQINLRVPSFDANTTIWKEIMIPLKGEGQIGYRIMNLCRFLWSCCSFSASYCQSIYKRYSVIAPS